MNRVFFLKKYSLALKVLLLLFLIGGLFLLGAIDALANPPQTANPVSSDGSTRLHTFNIFERAIHSVVISITGLVAGLGGYFLDQATQFFVRDFGSIYRQYETQLELVWATFRDIINLALILGLVYVGFRFILEADDGAAKKNLVSIIIAALLVNFSLFFAKLVIEIGNVLASNFAQSVIDLGEGDTTAGTMINLLRVATVLEVEANASSVSVVGSVMAHIFMSGFILIVAGIVFFYAAIVLLTRFVVLHFLIVTSPIAVLGWIFPRLSGTSNKWLQTLFNQSFVAAAMFFFFYVSLLIISTLGSSDLVADEGLSAGAALTAAPGSVIGSFTIFILGAGLLIGSLIAAQSLGAAGGAAGVGMLKTIQGKITNGGKNIARAVPRAAAASSAATMRATRGRAAVKKINSKDYQRKLANNEITKEQHERLKRRAESSYDVRNIPKAFKKNSMLNVQEGGYAATEKARLEAAEKLREERVTAGKATVESADEIKSQIEAKGVVRKADGSEVNINNLKTDAENAEFVYNNTAARTEAKLAPLRENVQNIAKELKTATGPRVQELQGQLEGAKTELAAEEQKANKELQRVKELTDKTNNTYNETIKEAIKTKQADHIYGSIFKEIEELETSTSTKRSVGAIVKQSFAGSGMAALGGIAGGAAAGGAAGAVVGGALPVVTAAGTAVTGVKAQSRQDMNERMLRQLQQKYAGKNPSKLMDEDKKKKENINILTELQKEANISTGSGDKDKN